MIKKFVADCQARGLTAHTIETYRSNVQLFLQRCKDPCTVNLEDLKVFLGELRARDLRGSTLKGYFAAIGAYYDFLIFSGAMNASPIPPFRKRYLRMKEQQNGENTRQLISVQDLQLLVSAAHDIRERALIMTPPKTGMRKGELLSLKEVDINLNQGTIRIPPKAKRSNRLVFMDEELKETLREYLVWRAPRATSSWLWISEHGGRIHKDIPNRIIARLAEPLGLHDPEGPISRKLTCHCMRHWFTTHLFRAGMNPEHIKWLRGDAMQKEAWQIYNHIDPEEVRQEYLRRIPQLISFDQKLERYL